MKPAEHPWTFRSRFRARAFGWKGSQPAIQRLKEALSEIKRVSRKDPLTAAEGAIQLMERLWPALQQVDSSSGALGTATSKTVHALIDILLVASAEEAILERQLDRLWTAVEEDGVDFLSEVADRWGELCRTPERASRAADDFLPTLRLSWRPEHRGYFKGTTACLSCLLAAGRHQELLDLIETAPFLWWHYRRYGVRALGAQGRTDEAIRYAEASLGLNDSAAAMARACEAILLAAGRRAEAYGRYAVAANQAGTHLATFRAIQTKYPEKEPRAILDDLIGSAPKDAGRWFAAAKTLGFLDLAAELARRSTVEIGALLRAARDHVDSEPDFALDCATAALHWMAEGRFYELKVGDVWQAQSHSLRAAEAVGRLEPTRALIEGLIASDATDPFVRKHLSRPFGVAVGR